MLVSLGLDHRQARLEIRERFHLEAHDVPRVYAGLAERGVEEAVLARTCNRVEIYGWWPEPDVGPDPHGLARALAQVWMDGNESEADALLEHASLRTGGDVARHLLRVAGGLESRILGDIHILGQLRRAFREAVETGTAGSHLHRLFETALRVGKQVQRRTSLMGTRNGVGSEAARAALNRFGSLADRSCIVVGCGKSGTHAARCLAERGAGRLTVVNRTPHRAETLARDLGHARAAGLEELPELLDLADVVVVATSAPEPVVTRAMLRQSGAHQARRGRPFFVIDVSVPRNVEASVAGLVDVELLDLDELHPEAAEIEASRAAAVPQAEAIVEQGRDEFLCWLDLHAARHALRPLRQVLAEVCRRELNHLAGDSPHAERAAQRIVARVMSHPMTALRSAAERGEPVDALAESVRDLFASARLSSETGDWASSTG